MSTYSTHIRSAYYGVWCALPLLAVYEALLWAVGPSHGMQVRNAADVWLRLLLESLGLGPARATLAMMAVLIVMIPILRRGEIRLRLRYLIGIVAEALLYSVALGIVINLVLYVLLYSWLGDDAATALARLSVEWRTHAHSAHAWPLAITNAREELQDLALSLGAGLFEELAFRVVLLSGLLWFFRLVFPPTFAATLAIALAALAFALAHYGGELGDTFSIHSLLYRWMAGLLFTLLYYWRGFAITAYSHALYDIWVMLLP
jgi:hypothetical protein